MHHPQPRRASIWSWTKQHEHLRICSWHWPPLTRAPFMLPTLRKPNNDRW